MVCVQLEEFAAIQNAGEILRVDGVDVFFVGPSDLSQSMGFIGRPDAPEVKSAIAQPLEKIVATGKMPGMPGTTQSVATIRERGVLYIYTHLPVLLASAAQDFFMAAEGRNIAGK